MAGRHRSVPLSLELRTAGRACTCTHNARHRIAKGDVRLVVNDPGPPSGEHGRAPCGLSTLAAARDALEQHVESLNNWHGRRTDPGAGAFAQRPRSELVATGGRPPPPTARTTHGLTPQEGQAAALAASGATNAEIARRRADATSRIAWSRRLTDRGARHGEIVDAHYAPSFKDPDGLPLEVFCPPGA
jgi:hypothetical protein